MVSELLAFGFLFQGQVPPAITGFKAGLRFVIGLKQGDFADLNMRVNLKRGLKLERKGVMLFLLPIRGGKLTKRA
jgi:hypothetical protein